jgi:hypothetical protein
MADLKIATAYRVAGDVELLPPGVQTGDMVVSVLCFGHENYEAK